MPRLSGRQHSLIRRTGVGIVVSLLTIVCTILAAAGIVNILSEPLEDAGTLASVIVVTAAAGLGIGVQCREKWFLPTLIAGGLTGGFLFLRGQVFLTQGSPISYPLLFGLPGTVAAIVFLLGGGWLGSHSAVAARFSLYNVSPLTRAGLAIAVGWTILELLFGIGLSTTVGTVLNNTFVGILIATLVGFPVAAVFAVRYGRQVGVNCSDWDYRTDGWTIMFGFVSGAITVLAVYGIAIINAWLRGTETAVAAFGFLLADLKVGFWVVVLFALAHGLVAPMTEELAWRGIIQSAVVQSEGVAIGIVFTAIVFTLKHALLDLSLVRVPSVLILAFALGAVRHRWGTTASTVAHGVVNLTSVCLLAIYVFG